MMSRVEDVTAAGKIGMRVEGCMHPGDEKQPPYPYSSQRREMSRKRGSVAAVGVAESTAPGRPKPVRPI